MLVNKVLSTYKVDLSTWKIKSNPNHKNVHLDKHMKFN
jgi:hypothetical protein